MDTVTRSRGRTLCINCGLTIGAGGQADVGDAGLAAPSETIADETTVFRAGAVYTLDPERPWAQAVAVRGKHILAVGSDDEVIAAGGPDARIVELDGRMLLPGFIEAHIHPLLGAFLTSGVDLQLPTREAALTAIAEYADSNPTGPIRGFGWRVDMFGPGGPHRDDLDAVVADRPVVMFAIDGHSLWVNSKTLEIMGVTRETPDPVPGFSFYTRDAAGEPTGWVLESEAVLEVVNAIEPMTGELLAQQFARWTTKASAAGITSLFDAGMPPKDDETVGLAGVYTNLEAQGLLPFRVVCSHVVKAPPIDDAVDRTLRMRKLLDTELVTGGVLKILGDGTVEGHTGYLLEPYADLPDSVGQSPFDEAQWRQLITDADAAGIDVHIHAIGDRTARLALDAIESATKNNPPRDRRHAIAHLEFVHDTDLPRFGELGVIGQFSANWMSADPNTVDVTRERCGDRQRRIFQPRAILDGGATIAFGTDWPAAGWFSTYKPLDSIEVAVTRRLVGQPDAPVLEPEGQRLDLEQALHASTLGAARQLRLDHLVGSIQPGKLADLVVLRHNLFDIAPSAIASTSVDMTMMNGKFRHGG
jgi:predicted amidohydrolase YtcJ